MYRLQGAEGIHKLLDKLELIRSASAVSDNIGWYLYWKNDNSGSLHSASDERSMTTNYV